MIFKINIAEQYKCEYCGRTERGHIKDDGNGNVKDYPPKGWFNIRLSKFSALKHYCPRCLDHTGLPENKES